MHFIYLEVVVEDCFQWIRYNMAIVQSLQARIVKAVRANRWNLVKVVQGILHRSYGARLLAIAVAILFSIKLIEDNIYRHSKLDSKIYY